MFGKIFLVFTAVVSVLLAGVSMVAFFAVPGMHPAMAELQDYSFEAQAGEKVTWTVTKRLGDGGTVGSNLTIFDAVIRARNDMKQRLQSEVTEMSQQQTEVERQLALVTAEQAQDLEAMNRQIAELEAIAADEESYVIARSGVFQDLSVRGRIVRDEVASRREDVVRLRQELEELRTHIYELTQLRRTLMDRLLRIRLDNQSLERRESQLRQQLAPQ